MRKDLQFHVFVIRLGKISTFVLPFLFLLSVLDVECTGMMQQSILLHQMGTMLHMIAGGIKKRYVYIDN